MGNSENDVSTRGRVTNILFKNNSRTNPVRLILGLPGEACRSEYDAICELAMKTNAEPIVIVRASEPNIWVDDDSAFVLDLMAFPYTSKRLDWPDGLEAWWRSIECSDVREGMKFTFSCSGLEITATADATPMCDFRMLEEHEL